MCFFFFNDTATTEIYTLSLHDALPIYLPFGVELEEAVPAFAVEQEHRGVDRDPGGRADADRGQRGTGLAGPQRSEEHTSELQSRQYLVCRLLLEKKKRSFHTNT